MLSPPPATSDTPTPKATFEGAPSDLDELGPVEDQVASNPATPGLHVPGAFPGVTLQDTYVKDAAITVLQTAKGYVPTSVDDVKRFVENTGDIVGGYLPQSVAIYLR